MAAPRDVNNLIELPSRENAGDCSFRVIDYSVFVAKAKDLSEEAVAKKVVASGGRHFAT